MECEVQINGFSNGVLVYSDSANIYTTPDTVGAGNRTWVLDRVEYLLKDPDVTDIQIEIAEA